jgi:plastocyanin
MKSGLPRYIRVGVLLCCAILASAQEVTVTARIALLKGAKVTHSQAQNVVLWLTPVGNQPLTSPAPTDVPKPRLTQQGKRFSPHVLIVPVGAVVEFPNRDPFFHNVFSLFEGKRFDLGLYEAGTTRDVHFDKPGISYIFCNIHAEMSAVVIALETPYFGVSNQRGEIVIPHVPVGRYNLQIWDEVAIPETLNAMTREITVAEDTSTLGVFRLPEVAAQRSHKNKYGRDYDPPAPDNPIYVHP